MDINQLLKGLSCGCGKNHICNIKQVYIEKNAFDRLRELCADYGKILVVADENTISAAGEGVLSTLDGKTINKVIFGSEILVPDESAINAVSEGLDGAELILGIGSGVIQDLCKYVSFVSKTPYIIVATAPSMDGYASDGAAMITNGMKVTYKATLPLAIIADTEVIKNAPIDMIKAGYGDIIGKLSALNDWKLSRLVTGEYLCDYIYNTTYEQIERTIKLADGILKRDEESIKTLMEALVIIGILMSFAGSSRPASGSEHHLSHFFEITGIINKTPYFPHGIDVAYSTYITARLREETVSRCFPKYIFRLENARYIDEMNRVYKNVASGCIELQNKVGNYKCDRASLYGEKEAEIKAILGEMPSSVEIKKLLSLAQLDTDEFFAFYGEEQINDAILYANDLKDRYTVLWLCYDLFGKPL